MSITNELRKYVQCWREHPDMLEDLDAGDIDGILADFERFADRIDAEHEREARRAHKGGAVGHAYMDITPRVDWARLADELDVFSQLVRGFAEQVGEGEGELC